jgi:hypothetical protein
MVENKIDNKPAKRITTTEIYNKKGDLIKKTKKTTHYQPKPEDEG